MLRILAVALLLLPAFAVAAGDDGAFMTLPEYRKGLKELRGYFVKRGEDETVANRYIADLETAFPVALGESVPVTKGVFGAFLRYQAAWTRKTRDSKNPAVTPVDLQHEVERARELKAAFKADAEAHSPRFYSAFQAAVKDVRSTRRRDGQGYTGTSNVFFSDQVDDSYTHVDAGDEALEKGDAATAIKEADAALAVNPGNADALVLKAGAEYDKQDVPAAIADAQSALILDPQNRQAQAILSLTATNPAAAKAVAEAANGGSAGLADDGRKTGQGRLADSIDNGKAVAASLNPFAASAALRLAPSATPAVGKILAEDLNIRAVGIAASDPRGSMSQLGQAMALDPHNSSARGWYSTVANRVGEYSAALGSSQQGVEENPNDALAYYNKAYALAGTGDRAGMVDAMAQAARIDPSYAPAATQAAGMDPKQALDTLFGIPSQQRQPAVPQPRHHGEFALMLMTGFVASLLIVSGVSLYFQSTARPRVRRS